MNINLDSPLVRLPTELKLSIFEFLPVKSICHLKWICKNFNLIITESFLAKMALKTGFLHDYFLCKKIKRIGWDNPEYLKAVVQQFFTHVKHPDSFDCFFMHLSTPSKNLDIRFQKSHSQKAVEFILENLPSSLQLFCLNPQLNRTQLKPVFSHLNATSTLKKLLEKKIVIKQLIIGDLFEQPSVQDLQIFHLFISKVEELTLYNGYQPVYEMLKGGSLSRFSAVMNYQEASMPAIHTLYLASISSSILQTNNMQWISRCSTLRTLRIENRLTVSGVKELAQFRPQIEEIKYELQSVDDNPAKLEVIGAILSSFPNLKRITYKDKVNLTADEIKNYIQLVINELSQEIFADFQIESNERQVVSFRLKGEKRPNFSKENSANNFENKRKCVVTHNNFSLMSSPH